MAATCVFDPLAWNSYLLYAAQVCQKILDAIGSQESRLRTVRANGYPLNGWRTGRGVLRSLTRGPERTIASESLFYEHSLQ
jgi:hypothetical protein